MIGRIYGKLLEKQPPQIVVEAGGIGYEVDVPMTVFYALPPAGENVLLYTHLQVREDAHLLYGFASAAERALFRQLLKVGGIGAKTALGLLSAMTADELAQAVAQEDVKRLCAAPGIGKKTAERLVLELRGKLAPAAGVPALPVAAADSREDVVSTLLALGYSEREARAAVKHVPENAEVGEGVRLALKSLAK